MVKDSIKIIGVTIGLSWIAFIALAIFLKGLGVLFDDWFVTNAMVITVVSGIIVLLLIAIGAITLTSLGRKR